MKTKYIDYEEKELHSQLLKQFFEVKLVERLADV